MTHKSRRSKIGLLAVGLFLLALVPLLWAGVGRAQEGANEEHSIGPRLREPLKAKPADLIITDPQADVQEIIEEALGESVDGSVVVSAAAFYPEDHNQKWDFDAGGGYLHPDSGSYTGFAPVNLPDGATITAVTGYVYDLDGSTNINISLWSTIYNFWNSSQAIALAFSEGSSGTIQAITDTTIGDHGNPVDNSTYAYFVGTGTTATTDNHRFFSIEIFYTQ